MAVCVGVYVCVWFFVRHSTIIKVLMSGHIYDQLQCNFKAIYRGNGKMAEREERERESRREQEYSFKLKPLKWDLFKFMALKINKFDEIF